MLVLFCPTETTESKLGTNTALVRTIKYTTVAGLVMHWMACGWYAIGCSGWHEPLTLVQCADDSWPLNFELGKLCHVKRL